MSVVRRRCTRGQTSTPERPLLEDYFAETGEKRATFSDFRCDVERDRTRVRVRGAKPTLERAVEEIPEQRPRIATHRAVIGVHPRSAGSGVIWTGPVVELSEPSPASTVRAPMRP